MNDLAQFKPAFNGINTLLLIHTFDWEQRLQRCDHAIFLKRSITSFQYTKISHEIKEGYLQIVLYMSTACYTSMYTVCYTDKNWKSLQCWQKCENESHRITHIFYRKHQYLLLLVVTNIFSIVKKSLISHPTKSEKMTNIVIVRHIDLCMHERLLDEARGTKRLRICLWSLGHIWYIMKKKTHYLTGLFINQSSYLYIATN
jgi:hypothetical protein